MSQSTNNGWQSRRASLLESKSGKIAVVVTYGRGYSPAVLLQEIKKDGTPAKREAYWSRGNTWRTKGWCQMHSLRKQDTLLYRFTDFVLFETTPPHNPDGHKFRYIVTVHSSIPDKDDVLADVVLMATSGKEASGAVARDPLVFGIRGQVLVLGARPAGVHERNLPLTPILTVTAEERKAAYKEASRMPKGCIIFGVISLALFGMVILSIWIK